MQLKLSILPSLCAPGTYYCGMTRGIVDSKLAQDFKAFTQPVIRESSQRPLDIGSIALTGQPHAPQISSSSIIKMKLNTRETFMTLIYFRFHMFDFTSPAIEFHRVPQGWAKTITFLNIDLLPARDVVHYTPFSPITFSRIV